MSTDYTNAAQQRLLKVCAILARDVVQGVAPAQIAKNLDVPASFVTRDLFNLESMGWARKNETTGRWLVGPELATIAAKALAALAKAKAKIAELENQFIV